MSVWATVSEDDSDGKKRILVDASGKRYLIATCVEEEISIDGRFDDYVWQDAVFQGDFLQREPNEGEPATEKTEIGVLFDKDNIYFGVKCYDSEPDKIIAREMRRDEDMRDDDTINIILDTYHDHRSGFYFVTNANGSKRDAVLANEGRNYNSAWDGIWTSRARINDEGWFAEIAIPWKTLRFADQDSVVWGINISRTIRRKNENVFWQLVPRDLGFFGLFRISEAGNLCGLNDLRTGGNLELKPYFLGGLERDQVTEFRTDRLGDIGLDTKIGLTANLAMDITVNTDFAQVEADQEQVNLTRFSLYYPEKREFFLEGAEIFSFGRSGGRWMHRGGGDAINLFYSRRIGLFEGEEARILGGVKMVGKLGQYHVGVLNMLTDELFIEESEEDDEESDTTYTVPRTNFTVVRVRRDILKRGSIGMMFLNKEALDTTSYNRSMGLDGYFPITDNFTVSGTLSGTFEPSEDHENKFLYADRNLAGNLGLEYQSDLWDFSLSYMDVGADFNPELGFIRRVGFRLTDASMEYSPRPKGKSNIRQYNYQLEGKYRTDHSNRVLESEMNASFTLRFQNSARFTVGMQRESEFIDEDWEVRDGFVVPVGMYSGFDYYIRTSSDQSRDISGRININYGNYYTGRNLRFEIDGNFTRIRRLRLEINYNHNWVDLPEGSFRTNTLGLRTFYYFSTELYFKAYVQWNDDKLFFDGKEKIISNFLLRWIYRPGSDLYIVYNDGRLIGPGGEEITNRTLMVKTTFFWRK
jgi:hypothetical protein